MYRQERLNYNGRYNMYVTKAYTPIPSLHIMYVYVPPLPPHPSPLPPRQLYTNLKDSIQEDDDGHKEEVCDEVPESSGEPVDHSTHPTHQLEVQCLP